MIIPILLFVVGLALLIKGGDWFVDGAVGIARKFNIPQLLIGATVVSIGTTLPEVMVSATSAWGGHGEIAYGNAIGSIICNTSLIAAITIAIKPSKAERSSLIVPVIFFFVSAAIYATVAYATGKFTRTTGFILLAIFVLYIGINVYNVVKKPSTQNQEEESQEEINMPKNIVMLVVGAAFIALGAKLLVDNGIIIADKVGVPESVIALTFVALGTSLPELVTAITALLKGHGALSLGNIIGANIFNLVFVSGISVAISPFAVPEASKIMGHNASLVMDIPVMFAVMLMLTIPAIVRQKLTRLQGILLLAVYAAFCTVQFMM